MAQRAPIAPDANTPRQKFTVAAGVIVLGTTELGAIWGQTPEEGDPVAALQYAETDHRTWKQVALQPTALLPHGTSRRGWNGVRGGRG